MDDSPAWAQGNGKPLVAFLPALDSLLDSKHHVDEERVELRVRAGDGRHQVVRISRVISDQPLSEGLELFAAESEVGELTGVTDTAQILRHASAPGHARIVLVSGPAELPVVLVQGFFPLKGATLEELAGVVQEVALRADDLEHRIFGADCG